MQISPYPTMTIPAITVIRCHIFITPTRSIANFFSARACTNA
jgi:hypothetical protein